MSMRPFLLILLVGAALTACGLDPSDDEALAPPDGETVELASGGEVTISLGLKTCSRDSDCTLVWTGCDGCCQRQAIRTSYQTWYAEAFQTACTGYSGPVCDCTPGPAVARCVRNTCEAVAVDS